MSGNLAKAGNLRKHVTYGFPELAKGNIFLLKMIIIKYSFQLVVLAPWWTIAKIGD